MDRNQKIMMVAAGKQGPILWSDSQRHNSYASLGNINKLKKGHVRPVSGTDVDLVCCATVQEKATTSQGLRKVSFPRVQIGFVRTLSCNFLICVCVNEVN